MNKFIPTFSDHLARYVFAVDYCYKREVLDAGCKEGFGSHILSYGAKRISLVDINKKFLDKAKNWYKYFCPVEFVECDFEKSFPNGEWETIIALEVIEHLNNPDFFIENIKNHLKVGGRLIFSVPHMVANKEHKVLFDEKGIRTLIEKHLKLTEFYIQDKKIYSNKLRYKKLICYLGVAEKVG